MKHRTFLRTTVALVIAFSGILAAQSLAVNEIYSCNNGSVKLRVTGCTGTEDTDLWDGRYSTGTFGNAGIVFKGAKATLAMYGETEDVECWTGGDKIFLRKTGEPDDLALDINNDRTPDSPMGELKKKGN